MNSDAESINGKPWNKAQPPQRILVIRLQAFGDTVITLPWIASLREQLPNAIIDFLILNKNAELPNSLHLFNRVYRVAGNTAKLQFIRIQFLLPFLFGNRYDVIIDLQRSKISRWVRYWSFPKAWSEIERFSKTLAGEKFKAGIQAAGFQNIGIAPLKLKVDEGEGLLKKAGWNGNAKIVVLNPAGNFVTRNWPVQNYVDFANAWLRDIDSKAIFVFLGIERLIIKTEFIVSQLGTARTINFVNQLTMSESFAVLAQAQLVLSEDSGLMHMAWVQGVPTLALFGSSPSYWSAPMGPLSKCLNSSDLPCGNCFSDTCKLGDVRCLTRYSPEYVLKEAKILLSKS